MGTYNSRRVELHLKHSYTEMQAPRTLISVVVLLIKHYLTNPFLCLQLRTHFTVHMALLVVGNAPKYTKMGSNHTIFNLFHMHIRLVLM